MKKRSLSFKGHLWALGKSEEDPPKKVVEDEGREWLAITAFPLFAGTCGTIASALNICSLVQSWKCELAAGKLLVDVSDIPDPSWLTGVNIMSLVFGAVANIAMLLIRGDTSFPLAKYLLKLVLTAIICGYIASILLIALVVSAALGLNYPSPPQHAFTQAYFYAIEAAILYFVTSTFITYTAYMLWNSRRTRNELSKQFASGHLSLKVLTIVFMSYILIGAKVFSKIESWRYLDGVFWADVTILTVGFGDIKPQTHLGRSLLFPYAACGIFLLFLILYCITQVVFERGGSLWEARLREQERRREVDRRAERSKSKGKKHTPEIQNSNGPFFLSRANDNSKPFKPSQQVSEQATAEDDQTEKPPPPRSKDEDREKRRQDFEKMQEIALRATRRRIYLSIGLWFLFSMFLWIVGAALFYFSERAQGWTYFNAIYFTFISLLTIGYGDNNLLSMAGKAIFVLWSLIVIPSLTMLISTGTELVGMPYLTSMTRWVKEKLSKKGKELPRIKNTLSTSLEPFSLPHNNHDKNHLIVQAIKSIARDHIQKTADNTPAAYSFEDWEYIFYLMGVLDPNDSSEPTKLTPIPKDQTAPSRAIGNQSSSDGNGNGACSGGEEVRETPTGLENWQGDGEVLDWLHRKNPLNASETVTEWMLFTLVEKLEGELRELRRRMGNTPIGGESGTVM